MGEKRTRENYKGIFDRIIKIIENNDVLFGTVLMNMIHRQRMEEDLI